MRLYYKDYNQTLYLCSCGKYIARGYKRAHKKTTIHKKLLDCKVIQKPNLCLKID